jgi:hypothetical protein
MNDASYSHGHAVTKHDTNPSIGGGTVKCDALFIGGAGNVVATVDGVDLTFLGLAAGSILPVRASAVKSTNTTATGIIALWRTY